MALRTRPLVIVACVMLCLLLVVTVAIAIWRSTSNGQDDDENNSSNFDRSFSYAIGPQNITLALKGNSAASLDLQLVLALGAESSEIHKTDQWSSDGIVSMQWSSGMSMEMKKTVDESSIACLTINWTMPESAEETVIDCVDSTNLLWYGGFEESYQHWPLNKLSLPMAAFVTGDAYNKREIGNVIEPLFVSSHGFGIYVEESVPLYISFNHQAAGTFCLQGRTGTNTPFFQNNSVTRLAYHVCRSTDVTQIWKEMTRMFISKPQDIPSPSIFRYPIWSTWAMYKGFINQKKTLEFADAIINHGFGISQLEIDDNWTSKYGDFTFDPIKFPNAKAAISNLTAKGITVTVWIHPFFNNDSLAFKEISKVGYLIKDGTSPALTSWWRGQYAGILDLTNPKAVEWYLNKTDYLKSNFNVTSFKFDAGEVNWLPQVYETKNTMTSPSCYSQLFVKMAYRADTTQRRQEVRVGFKAQHLPILTRMIDRDSHWGHEKGLKSLIPTALTFSILGYPFILPDMIGGNAYDPNDLDKTVLPDAELFIRWLQVTTFMPTLQFSVAPWLYNETILAISREFVTLHESISANIVSLARNAVSTGEPIVRPLWWIAPNDPDALEIDSEYLLGNDILIAPVLEKGTRSRDIYLPTGRWRHEKTGAIHSGPVWLKDFPSPINELPYFYKL